MELVSVIMPCYNMEKYVGNSIASIQAQTYANWELLVVDDGSKDRSREILSRMASEDPRIKPIFLEQNRGITNARNTGLDHSSGRYIAFLDSDDLWEPEKLHKHIEFMATNDVAFTYSAYHRIKEDGTYINLKSVPPQLNYRKLLKKNEIGCLSVVIDKSKTGPVHMPNLKHEDYATWLNVLRDTGFTAYGLQEPLAKYLVREGSVSRNKWRSMTWVYRIYRKQENFSQVKSLFYLIRWFLLSTMS